MPNPSLIMFPQKRGSILYSLFFALLLGGAISAAVAFYWMNPDFFHGSAPPEKVAEVTPAEAIPEPVREEEPEDPEPPEIEEPEETVDPEEELRERIALIREPVDLKNQQEVTIRAWLLNLNNDQLTIRRTDDAEMTFSTSLLSEESQSFVRAHADAIQALAAERAEAAREEARRQAAQGQIRSLPRFPLASVSDYPFAEGAILVYTERDPGYVDTQIAFRDEKQQMWPTFFIGRPIGEGNFRVDFRRPESKSLGWHFHHGVQVEGEQTRRVLGDLWKNGSTPEVRVEILEVGNLTTQDADHDRPYFPVLLRLQLGPYEGRTLGRMEFTPVGRGPGRGMVRCRLEFTFAGAAFGLSTGTSGDLVQGVIISGGRLRE